MRVLICFIFIFTISSCDSPDKVNEEKAASKYSKTEFDLLAETSDKLVLKKYFIPRDSNMLRSAINIIKEDSITDITKIKEFGSLFQKSKDMGYCFGQYGHYSITILKGKAILKQYYIDTLGINGSAIFCGQDYQSSFLINLKNWNSWIEKR